ncbi:MAG: ribbon-helix-helix domain-containing protein [Sneathiellales bacterium]|nr:ribbon-helix-helix domain-containing protein [Sneathiellales bacterium]
MSELVKHSVSISGHRTSISLEPEFWDLFTEYAEQADLSLNALVTEIDATRTGNLSSAIRLFVLHHLLQENEKLNDRLSTLEKPS